MDEFQFYLDTHPLIHADVIERWLAQGIIYKNNIAISMINLYILEHKIIITTSGLYSEIYREECSYESNMARGNSMISFKEYQGMREYVKSKYQHLIKYN